MSIDLGRLLIDAGVVPRAEVEAALFISVVRGIPFPRALVDRGAISERALEAELERRGGGIALQQVIGSRELFARLPREICRRLGAVPTRLDPASGTVDVAAADPLDRHVAAELSVHLGMPVRLLRAPMAAIEAAIRALDLDGRPAAPAPRWRRVTPAFPFGAPQSTIPPPPSDQAPIPLVRRVVVPASGDEAEIALPLLRQTTPAAADGPMTLRGPLRHPGLRPDQPDYPQADAPPTLRGAALPAGPASGRWREPGRAVAPVEVEVPSPLSPSPATPPGSGQPDPWAAPVTPHAPSTLPQGRLRIARSAQPPESLPATVPGEAQGVDPAVFADLGEILEAIHVARSRDEIVELSLRGLGRLARRAALFAVKRGTFLGYACTPELGDQAALRDVAIPTGQPSILATATATGMYLGPVPGTPAHAPLLAVMGEASPDVAAVAVRVAGRPVLVFLADELGDTMIGTRSMDELARAVGDALTRILSARL